MKKSPPHFSVIIVHGYGAPPTSWLSAVDVWAAGKLTKQEKFVLIYLRRGLLDKEIANALNLSVATVRKHLQTAMKKLGCRNRVEAALWADRNIWPAGGYLINSDR